MSLRAVALALLLVQGTLAAQNRDHPGLVHLGDGEWGTRAQARERGLFEHQRRWLDPELENDVERWERADAKGLAWDDAYRSKSKYYRIETNVPRFILELELKPFLDELFETYARVFREDFGLAGKAAGNKDIRIYHGFLDYSDNEGNRPRTNPGFYVDGAVLVVYYDDTDPGLFYSTVFHEGAHQFFRSLLPGAQPPHWLTEALATYFEGCTYSRATGKVTPGFVAADRLQVAQSLLRGGDGGGPDGLFMQVPRERFQGREYALAWSFTHYLIHRPSPGAREGFARFVRELNGSGVKPAAEVFEETTDETLAAIQPGWRAHVLALRAPAEIQWVVLDVKDAGPEEDLRPGDLLWSFDHVEIYGAKAFTELWKARATDRPLEVTVVRCEPDRDDPRHTRRFVQAKLLPGSRIELRARAEFARHGGLKD
jgi:hypothetical protein